MYRQGNDTRRKLNICLYSMQKYQWSPWSPGGFAWWAEFPFSGRLTGLRACVNLNFLNANCLISSEQLWSAAESHQCDNDCVAQRGPGAAYCTCGDRYSVKKNPSFQDQIWTLDNTELLSCTVRVHTSSHTILLIMKQENMYLWGCVLRTVGATFMYSALHCQTSSFIVVHTPVPLTIMAYFWPKTPWSEARRV